jgi:hypothetical protein
MVNQLTSHVFKENVRKCLLTSCTRSNPLTLLTPDITEYHALLYVMLEDLTGKILRLTIGWLRPKTHVSKGLRQMPNSLTTSSIEGVRPVSELSKTTKAQMVF